MFISIQNRFVCWVELVCLPDAEVDGKVESAVDQHEELDQLLDVQVPDAQVALQQSPS